MATRPRIEATPNAVAALQRIALPGAAGANAAGRRMSLGEGPVMSLKDIVDWNSGVWSHGDMSWRRNKGVGEQALDSLKSFGEGAMNTLSMTSAIPQVAISKVLQAFGRGDSMDFADMLGHWRDDYSNDDFVRQLGGNPDHWAGKAAGTVLDVAIDPLWFVAPVKVAKTAGQAGKAIKDVEAAITAGKVAAGAARGATAADEAAEAAVAARAGVAALSDVASSNKTVHGQLKEIFGTSVQRNKTVKVPENARGDWAITDPTGDALRVVKADIIGDWAVVQTRRASKQRGGEKAEYKLFKVEEEDGVYTLVDKSGVGSFPNKTKALEEVVRQSDPTRLVHLNPETGLNSIEGTNSMFERMMASFGKAHEKGQVGIKLGVGRHNPLGGKGLSGWNYTVPTKITYPGLAMNSLGPFRGTVQAPKNPTGVKKYLAGAYEMFNKTPVEGLAHRIATAGREQSQAVEAIVERVMRPRLRADVARRTGLAGDELDNATDEAAKIITLVAHADAADPRVIELVGGGAPGDVGWMMREALKSENKWSREMEDILSAMRLRFSESRENIGMAGRLGGVDDARGLYFPQGATRASIKDERAARELMESDAGRRGMFSGKGVSKGDIDSELSRRYDSAFAWKTEDEWRQVLEEELGLSKELTDDIMDNLPQRLEELDSTTYWRAKVDRDKTTGVSMKAEDAPVSTYDLEMDAFNLFAMKEQSDIAVRVRLQIEQMLVDNGFVKELGRRKGAAGYNVPDGLATRDSKLEAVNQAAQMVVDRAMSRPRMAGLSGTFSNNDFGFALMNMISHLKNFLTTPWPRHYVNNAFGDFFNSLVRGNWRHLASQPKANLGRVNRVSSVDVVQKTGAKGDKFFRLAADDKRALAETYELFGKTYTGEEVLALSHMMGLGKGFVGEDIGSFLHLIKEPKTPYGRWSHYMKRQNMNREEAARLSNWVKHMEAGDEPFEAMFKTLDGIFDYGDLTNFEMLWMRNVLMFYTWMRKNTAFQVKAMFKKPALYNTYGQIEAHRPKDMFEPEYVKEMGLFWIPGLGSIYVGLPAADLHRLPTPWVTNPGDALGGLREYLRKDVLGSLNPLAKVPIEMALNKSFFTGGPIESYEGQLKRSPLGSLAALIPGMTTEGYANQAMKDAGKSQPLMGAWPAYLLEQISPIGQVGSQIQRADAALEGEKGLSALDALSAFVGIKRVPVNPDWERNSAYEAARRKAAETRRKNQLKEG